VWLIVGWAENNLSSNIVIVIIIMFVFTAKTLGMSAVICQSICCSLDSALCVCVCVWSIVVQGDWLKASSKIPADASDTENFANQQGAQFNLVFFGFKFLMCSFVDNLAFHNGAGAVG